MTLKGKARGRLIELDEALPFPDGARVSVTVTPERPQLRKGSPKLLLQIMRELPPVDSETVAEFERAIEAGSLPVRDDPDLFS